MPVVSPQNTHFEKPLRSTELGMVSSIAPSRNEILLFFSQEAWCSSVGEQPPKEGGGGEETVACFRPWLNGASLSHSKGEASSACLHEPDRGVPEQGGMRSCRGEEGLHAGCGIRQEE